MNKSLFASFVLILLVISIFPVYAAEQVAEYSSSFDVDTGKGSISTDVEQTDSFCGDSFIDATKGEQCDSSNLNGATCSSLLGSDFTGTLSCQSNCIYDTTQCTAVQVPTSTGGGGGGGGGVNIGSFQVTQSSPICIENWECSEWGVCLEGKQERSCTDKNNCTTILLKPEIERACETQVMVEEQNSNFLVKWLGAVIGVGDAPINIPLVSSFIIAIIAAMLILYAARKERTPNSQAEIKVNNSANQNNAKNQKINLF